MKVTWFGGTTLRLHIGGRILVFDAASVPAGIDSNELLSGADTAISLAAADLPRLRAPWRPRRPARLIDEVPGESIVMSRLDPLSVLVEAEGEVQVALVHCDAPPDLGNWADAAAIVLLGDDAAIPPVAQTFVAQANPKILLLAGSDRASDAVFDMLGAQGLGCGLVALEPGLALEL